MRSIYFSADVTTMDGSDTTDAGEYCGEGNGYTVESGWISPSWSRTTVHADRGDVTPDVYDASDLAIDPCEFDYSPLGWLVKRLNDTVYHIERESVSGDADTGVTLYASQADSDPYSGLDVRMAAHVYGYSLAQVEHAVTLVNSYDALVAASREYGIAVTLTRAMLGEPVNG